MLYLSLRRRPLLLSRLRAFGTYSVNSVILPQEPFVYGVSHFTPRTVPDHIVKPHYAGGPSTARDPGGLISLGSDAERRLRAAARLASDVREFAGTLVQAKVTTDEIDAAVHEYIIRHSAYPSPLLYSGFPRSCCTSVNNIISHGIPDDRPLEDGDIVNVDITVYLDGYHGDTSQTFLVGNVDDTGKELVEMTNRALQAGIDACAPGRPFSDIGKAIHDLIDPTSFSISPDFNGHGIGTEFHREPWIVHNLNNGAGRMMPGHCFTIEPAIIESKSPSCFIFPDGWTASTEDCSRSAQAEHMVLIIEDGAEVLTR
ncbi:methionyl aminopeptidase [Roridomyces roridus]|uniref:Methionine aminopeptidase n=1 Tax=Roridomyces roridus TaxID=1738132 RepID=A0AAD7B150_9AGAR|nr:methionyl aminopeptidase [Roridomyces roridus]